MQHLLLGMFANRASVEQDDIRIFDAVSADVTRAAQNGADRLRVGDIHLASVSLEVNPRMRGICSALIHKTKRNLRPRRPVDTTRLEYAASEKDRCAISKTGTGFAGAKLSEILPSARVARFVKDDKFGALRDFRV
jgi:hypothetical protein